MSGTAIVVRPASALGARAVAALTASDWTVIELDDGDEAGWDALIATLERRGDAVQLIVTAPPGGQGGAGPDGGQGGQVPEGMQGGQASGGMQSGQTSGGTQSGQASGGMQSGQASGGMQSGPGGGGMGGGASGELIAYLKKHQDGAEWLLAVSSSQGAAQLIVSSGEPVISMWGWSGSDKAMTLTKLKELVKKGELHYVQLGGGMGGGPGGGSTVRSEVTAWVQKHGTAVKESDYSNSTSTASGKRLRILFAVRPVDRLPPGRVRRQLTRRDRTPSNGPAPRSGAVPASPIMYTGCPANG